MDFVLGISLIWINMKLYLVAVCAKLDLPRNFQIWIKFYSKVVWLLEFIPTLSFQNFSFLLLFVKKIFSLSNL